MITFKCRHCGAPQSAESKELAHIVICFNCGKLATQADPPAPPKPAPKPVPEKRAEPQEPPRIQHVIADKPEPTTSENMARLASVFAWLACGLVTLGAAFFFFVGMAGAKSAPQEAAVAAACSFIVIAVYVLARSIEKVLTG